MTTLPHRRHFLRGAGVALALPWLEALAPRAHALAAPEGPPRGLVVLAGVLGMHAPLFFPEKAGRDFDLPPLLEPLADLRGDWTVFSGLSHPGVDGGHSSENSFLTAAPHPGRPTFRNSISLDQFLLEKLPPATRVPYLNLSTFSGSPLSWSAPASTCRPTNGHRGVFARLFLEGKPAEIADQQRKLAAGQSVLDAVEGQAKALERTLPGRDRDKLDEYLSAVREVEQRMQQADAWSRKPKPKVAVKPPVDIVTPADAFGRCRLLLDVAHLALETDSTRIVCLVVRGGKYVLPVQGVTTDWHNLSHHGQDAGKIDQLRRIEVAQMKELARFLTKLKGSTEAGGTLLDRTAVLFGSNLGNASSHDTRNLPILLAGGGFKHGQHLAFDPKNNAALPKVFVSLMQRLGLEIDSFAGTTGTMTGLELSAG